MTAEMTNPFVTGLARNEQRPSRGAMYRAFVTGQARNERHDFQTEET